MPLPLEGPRPLSPLEREAVELVFWDSIDPCNVYLTVLPVITVQGKSKRTASYSSGQITIDRSKFPYTDALGIKSRRAKTDIFKPGNMKYLSTLIHECTHHWQSTYGRYKWSGVDEKLRSHFTLKELTELHPLNHKWEDERNPHYKEDPNKQDILNLLKEQHASAAQVYFVIAWQLEYSSDSLVDLTTSSGEPDVGRVERYHRIDDIKFARRDDPNPPDDCNAAPPGRRVSRDCAMSIANDFNVFLDELRLWGG